MSDQLLQFDTRKVPVRILMIVTVGLAVLWSWFVVRWYVGNTLAEYLNPDENTLQTARLAVSLAPNDPLTHWRLGQVSQKKLPADQMDQVIKEYETAVGLSPNDYRFWMSLGAAFEQYGDNQKAELALRRSIELAPAYSYPAWYLGNLMLRNDRYNEAFVELRRASESNPELRPQLFNLAWEVYGSDLEPLKSAIGPTSEVRAQFALFLVEHNKFDDALRLWNSLNENEKRANRDTSKSIIAVLLKTKRFHDAMAVWNDLSPSLTYRAEVGKILDGGFEVDLSRNTDGGFGWQAKSVPQLQIGVDPNQQHGGGRSLRLSFQIRSKLDDVNLSQLVPVQPGVNYDLEYYVKTDRLQTGSPPLIQIVDAASNSVLVTSTDAPDGTTDWKRLTLTFKTGEKSEAVILRIVRTGCGESPVCPAFGIVWYDDFSLTQRG